MPRSPLLALVRSAAARVVAATSAKTTTASRGHALHPLPEYLAPLVVPSRSYSLTNVSLLDLILRHNVVTHACAVCVSCVHAFKLK